MADWRNLACGKLNIDKKILPMKKTNNTNISHSFRFSVDFFSVFLYSFYPILVLDGMKTHWSFTVLKLMIYAIACDLLKYLPKNTLPFIHLNITVMKCFLVHEYSLELIKMLWCFEKHFHFDSCEWRIHFHIR